jgi:hypothetical protein
MDVALKCHYFPFIRRRSMSTTTTRIEDDLKARVAAAAQRAGKTVPWDDVKAYLAAWAQRENGFKRENGL